MEKFVAVIDDDHAIRDGISSLLRSAGFDVRLYASAEAFLSDERTPPADVAITDIQMPGLSGLDLQAALKVRRPELPLMIMTAFPEEALKQRVLADGAICFLPKPFKAADLLYWVDRALSLRGPDSR